MENHSASQASPERDRVPWQIKESFLFNCTSKRKQKKAFELRLRISRAGKNFEPQGMNVFDCTLLTANDRHKTVLSLK